MTTVPVQVRGELVVEVKDLPSRGLDLIKSCLSFPNEDKETQQREQVHGWWALPDHIELWRVEERRNGKEVVVMPRGFALQLGRIVAEVGATPSFDDQRVATPSEEGYYGQGLLRDYQLDGAMAILKTQQGFVQAPAGSGKSNLILGSLAFMGVRTLVVLDKADIVDQWRERAEEFIGLSTDFDHPKAVGKIGMDVWEERDLTIALRQTLWARIDELDAMQWWGGWGATIYDEGQHLAADTLAAVSRRCCSQYMIGTSATPARTPLKGRIVEALVGPVIYRVDRRMLRERGILIKPVVARVETDFAADFWPTHDSKPDGTCEKPGCKKDGKHMHRNPYSSVVKKLTEDKARNKLIAENIVSERGHVHLVPSRQLKHLDALRKAIEEAGWDGPIYFLRGEENARGESRGIVKEVHEQHEAVILSTVADEALDVPPIDRVHLVFPLKQSAATEQLIGRAERPCEGKGGAVIYDYVDPGCEPLLNQSYERAQTYSRLELAVRGGEPKSVVLDVAGGLLSNDCDRWPIKVLHPLTEGKYIQVPTREHLYQAMKTRHPVEFDHVVQAPSAQEATERGMKLDPRPDWDEIKDTVMRSIIRDQCEAHHELVTELRKTIGGEIDMEDEVLARALIDVARDV